MYLAHPLSQRLLVPNKMYLNSVFPTNSYLLQRNFDEKSRLFFSHSIPGVDCTVGQWQSWSACSAPCGNSGISQRTRIKTGTESAGRTCPHPLLQVRTCNRFCHNHGKPLATRCQCNAGFTGTCCEHGGGPVTMPTLQTGTVNPGGRFITRVT